MAIKSIKELSQELAARVDYRLDRIEEEDYLRVDLSAHEKLDLETAFPLPKAQWSTFRLSVRFVSMTALIFAFIFSMSNAPAYYKLLKANVMEYMDSREANLEWSEASLFSSDPWSGEVLEAKVLVGEHAVEVMPATDPYASPSIPPLELNVSPLESRMAIPSLGIDAGIVEIPDSLNALRSQDWLSFDGQINDALLQGVLHYPGTAVPGQKGNAVFAGHSSTYFWDASSPYSTIFANLGSIQPGELIEINYNQEIYTYRVTEVYEVEPTDVNVLNQGDKYELTLITCTPVGTQLHRLIVKAELVE